MAPTVGFVSFRLGHADGVSVETAKWARVFAALGFRTTTVAGAGEADCILPGLAIDADEPPTRGDLDAALADADLVVVENVCSLPLNRRAADAVAACLQGRPAILHHHDFPWQQEQGPERPDRAGDTGPERPDRAGDTGPERPDRAGDTGPERPDRAGDTGPDAGEVDSGPPDDPAWVHVTINWLSRAQLADRGIRAVTIPNSFDTEAPGGDRQTTRAGLGIDVGERLVVQPTRAIPRKNVPAGLNLATALEATYWLVGPAEDGYAAEADRLFGTARVRVIRGLPDETTVPDAYAAADVVALPSRWEGFGNPTVESAVHRRPLAVGRYPVAREIAAYGFRWFPADRPAPLRRWLEKPDPSVLDTNQAIARRHFSMASLERRLDALVRDAGWVAT